MVAGGNTFADTFFVCTFSTYVVEGSRRRASRTIVPLRGLAHFPQLRFVNTPAPLRCLPHFSSCLKQRVFVGQSSIAPVTVNNGGLHGLRFLTTSTLHRNTSALVATNTVRSGRIHRATTITTGLNLRYITLLRGPVNAATRGCLAGNGHLLLSLFGARVRVYSTLASPGTRLRRLTAQIRTRNFHPCIVPINNSGTLNTLNCIRDTLRVTRRYRKTIGVSSIIITSNDTKARTKLTIKLRRLVPRDRLVNIAISHSITSRLPGIIGLRRTVTGRLRLATSTRVLL